MFAHDHLGSTLTTPATAHLTAAGAYDPYGNPDTPTRSPAFGYRGELHTGGLVHLRARDYHPAHGAFLSTDPLDGVSGHTTLTNPYHYAHNNPHTYTDPLGLRPWNDDDMRDPLDPQDFEYCPWPKHIPWIGESYCAGFVSRSPDAQAASRAATTAGPAGLALGGGAAVALPPTLGGSAWIGTAAGAGGGAAAASRVALPPQTPAGMQLVQTLPKYITDLRVLQTLGEPGRSAGARVIGGGVPAAREMFTRLVGQAQVATAGGRQWAIRADGIRVQLRITSSSKPYGRTVDVFKSVLGHKFKLKF